MKDTIVNHFQRNYESYPFYYAKNLDAIVGHKIIYVNEEE